MTTAAPTSTTQPQRARLALHHARTLREYHGRGLAIEIARDRLFESRTPMDAEYWTAVIEELERRM